MTYRRLPLRPSLAKSVRWCATLLTRISSKISRPASDLRTAAHFELRGRAITAEDMRGIASLLIGNKQLESLDLAANGFGEDGANACADILSACPTLTTLILDNNNIRAGVAVLSEKVAVHTGVRNLSLAANVIGPRASIAVADALAANTSLEQCSLASNAFGYKGGVAVGEALMRSAGPSPSPLLSAPSPTPSPFTFTLHPHPSPSPFTLTLHPHPSHTPSPFTLAHTQVGRNLQAPESRPVSLRGGCGGRRWACRRSLRREWPPALLYRHAGRSRTQV